MEVRSLEPEAGKYKEAQDWLNNFIKHNSTDPEALSLLSQVLLLDKKEIDAEKALLAAIYINSELPSIYRNQARLLLNQLKPAEALKKAQTAGANKVANGLLDELDLSANLVITQEGSAALVHELLGGLKSRQFAQAAFCIIDDGDKLHLGALVGTDSDLNAGKLIQSLAPIAGGKGGGKLDLARGAAPQRGRLDELEASAKKLLL